MYIYIHTIYIYTYIYIIYILSPHHRLNQIPKDPYCDGALAPALALRRPGSNRAHCEGSGHGTEMVPWIERLQPTYQWLGKMKPD